MSERSEELHAAFAARLERVRGAMSDEEFSHLVDDVIRTMQRFEEIVAANADKPLYLVEVCTKIGISARSLRMHCFDHIGMSPHRYLWLRRMNQVRRALSLADPQQMTVTKIATDYGFLELGRFSVGYRRLFGEPPSVTLRACRRAAVTT